MYKYFSYSDNQIIRFTTKKVIQNYILDNILQMWNETQTTKYEWVKTHKLNAILALYGFEKLNYKKYKQLKQHYVVKNVTKYGCYSKLDY